MDLHTFFSLKEHVIKKGTRKPTNYRRFLVFEITTVIHRAIRYEIFSTAVSKILEEMDWTSLETTIHAKNSPID